MRYYISDLHFYHENLNYQMDHRGFSNAAEMNAHMIHQWNLSLIHISFIIMLRAMKMDKSPGEVLVTWRLMLKGSVYSFARIPASSSL